MSEKTKLADTAALEFALECAKRGGFISIPLAEKCLYNLIVDSRGTLFRVRAKIAGIDRASGGQVVNSQKRVPNPPGVKPSSVAVPYDASDIDIFAVKFSDKWYLFKELGSLPATIKLAVGVRILRPDLEHSANNWHAIQL